MKKIFRVLLISLLLFSFALPVISFAAVDDAYSVYLLHMNGADGSPTFTDEAGHSFTAHADAQLDTAEKKFGSASGLWDGTGDYVSTTNSADIDLGTGIFTIDYWTYPTSFTNYNGVISTDNEAGGAKTYAIYTVTNGVVRFTITEAASDIVTSGDQTVTINQWNHVAIVRKKTDFTITAGGNAQVDTSKSKIGGASCQLDGTGDYLTWGNSLDFNFATSNFTIAFWIYATDFTGYNGLISSAVGTSGWCVYTNGNGVVRLTVDGASHDLVTSGDQSITTNQWVHVAVVRKGTGAADLNIYIDGTAGNAPTSGNVAINSAAAGVVIGRFYTNQDLHYWPGWIDEPIIVNGTAEWTSNFTPPDTAYATDYAGSVLLVHCDGDDASTTFTDVSAGGMLNLNIAINGAFGNAPSTATDAFNDQDLGMVIGRFYMATDNHYYDGWIDELRISKGIARWTENFTPPTEQYAGETGGSSQHVIQRTGRGIGVGIARGIR